MNNDFEKILNPNLLKNNLISISLFITAFELLKQSIIDKPKLMYLNGFNEKGFIYGVEYDQDVLSRNKSPVFASLDWLKEHDIIENIDIEYFKKVKNYRNEVAHQMVDFVTDKARDLDFSIFQILIDLMKKLEKNWFLYFEIELKPALYESKLINFDKFKSGNELLIQLITELALDNHGLIFTPDVEL